jgi:hypothetical protein
MWHVCRWYTSDLQVITVDVSMCPIMSPRLVSWHTENWCNSSVPRRWHLPSHQHLLKITWQPGSSQTVHMYKNHWQLMCQMDLWSIVVLKLGNYGPCCPQSQCHAQWLPPLWTPYEAPGWQALVVSQCKKCSCCWWPHKRLMSTTCYPCAMYTCKSEQNSQCQSACYLISLNLLCIYRI